MKELSDNVEMVIGIISSMYEHKSKDFVKGIIAYETNCRDDDILNKVYNFYMSNKEMQLLNPEIVEKVLKYEVKKKESDNND